MRFIFCLSYVSITFLLCFYGVPMVLLIVFRLFSYVSIIFLRWFYDASMWFLVCFYVCFYVVSLRFLWVSYDVPIVLPWCFFLCFYSVCIMFPWCFSYISPMFLYCFYDIPIMCPFCFYSVSLNVLICCYGASITFLSCFSFCFSHASMVFLWRCVMLRLDVSYAPFVFLFHDTSISYAFLLHGYVCLYYASYIMLLLCFHFVSMVFLF